MRFVWSPSRIRRRRTPTTRHRRSLVEACRPRTSASTASGSRTQLPAGGLCDPIPFASALAARTSRVGIGFAVIQLALRIPSARRALALLDNRVEGAGRGCRPRLALQRVRVRRYGLRSDAAASGAASARDPARAGRGASRTTASTTNEPARAAPARLPAAAPAHLAQRCDARSFAELGGSACQS